MAHDPGAQNAALLLRTIRGIVDFSGRSRRTEVGYYWIASSLAQAVLVFVVATPLTAGAQIAVTDAISLVLLLPYFALFVRRLHDMNQSGWWSLVLPLGILVSLPGRLAQLSPAVASAYMRGGSVWFSWAGLFVLIALFAITITPGTVGPNRFGSDPREGGPDTSAV